MYRYLSQIIFIVLKKYRNFNQRDASGVSWLFGSPRPIYKNATNSVALGRTQPTQKSLTRLYKLINRRQKSERTKLTQGLCHRVYLKKTKSMKLSTCLPVDNANSYPIHSYWIVYVRFIR